MDATKEKKRLVFWLAEWKGSPTLHQLELMQGTGLSAT